MASGSAKGPLGPMVDSAVGMSAGNSPTASRNEAGYWQRQIKASQKREEKYRKDAQRIVEIAGGDNAGTPFNILYSNTETLLPALYNDVPTPAISTRFKDEDKLGELASEAVSRVISYTTDSPTIIYESLHQLFKSVVTSALIPGRGAMQLFYDADIDEGPDPDGNESEIEKGGDSEAGDLDGQMSKTAEESMEQSNGGQGAATPPAIPQVKYEAVCGRYIPWDHLLLGYAKRWVDVPWVGIYYDMTKADVRASFGGTWAEKLKYSTETDSAGNRAESPEKRPEDTTRVWEIWHKSSRTVIFYAESWSDSIIKRVDDPLGLDGFYNIPEPLLLTDPIDGLVPIPLYKFYEQQAKELNRLTQRITKITEALKVRGFYDAGISGLKDLLTKDDAVLIPAGGVGQFKEGVDLNKSIWLMPLESLANVLQILQQQRQQVKQVIYEVTGISDILRGASVASETATAQNIKNQWGSLRLKRMQKAVQEYVRRCFRMVAEIAGEHFSEDTFAQMTGMPLLTSQQKQQLGQQIQAIQGQLQQMQQMQAQQQQMQQGQAGPPPPGMPPPASTAAGPPGAPPSAPGPGPGAASGPPGQPPQPDPQQQIMMQQQQQLQQMQAQFQAPAWPDVIALLKNDLTRAFKIDIETNSTIDPEAVEDRQATGEMMQALSGMLQQFMPAAQAGVLPMPAVKAILKATLKRFRYGPEVEDAINEIPDQLPQGEDPRISVEKIRQETELQKSQQPKPAAPPEPVDPNEQQRLQIEGQTALMQAQAKQRDVQSQMALADKKLQIAQAELDLKQQELAMKGEEMNMKQADMRAQAENKRRLDQVAFEGKIAALTAKRMGAMPVPQMAPVTPGGLPNANV